MAGLHTTHPRPGRGGDTGDGPSRPLRARSVADMLDARDSANAPPCLLLADSSAGLAPGPDGQPCPWCQRKPWEPGRRRPRIRHAASRTPTTIGAPVRPQAATAAYVKCAARHCSSPGSVDNMAGRRRPSTTVKKITPGMTARLPRRSDVTSAPIAVMRRATPKKAPSSTVMAPVGKAPERAFATPTTTHQVSANGRATVTTRCTNRDHRGVGAGRSNSSASSSKHSPPPTAIAIAAKRSPRTPFGTLPRPPANSTLAKAATAHAASVTHGTSRRPNHHPMSLDSCRRAVRVRSTVEWENPLGADPSVRPSVPPLEGRHRTVRPTRQGTAHPTRSPAIGCG